MGNIPESAENSIETNRVQHGFTFFGVVQQERPTGGGILELTIAILGTNSVLRHSVPCLDPPETVHPYYTGRIISFDALAIDSAVFGFGAVQAWKRDIDWAPSGDQSIYTYTLWAMDSREGNRCDDLPEAERPRHHEQRITFTGTKAQAKGVMNGFLLAGYGCVWDCGSDGAFPLSDEPIGGSLPPMPEQEAMPINAWHVLDSVRSFGGQAEIDQVNHQLSNMKIDSLYWGKRLERLGYVVVDGSSIIINVPAPVRKP